jgi:hypothetical protein
VLANCDKSKSHKSFRLQNAAQGRSVNLHPVARWRSANRGHFGVVCLAVVLDGLVTDMGLEALVEVVCAHACNDDCEDEKKNGEDGESSQRLARRLVVVLSVDVGNVHADELEQEVGHGDEVDDDNGDHASHRLATDPPRSEEKEEEGNDQGDGGEGKFNGLGVFDDHEKLHGKGEEEEKVELQEGNVNLILLVMQPKSEEESLPGRSDNASLVVDQR